MCHRRPRISMPASTLEIDGERVYVVDEGADRTAVPILLIHGFPSSSFSWHAVTPLLSTSRRVIVPDLVGLGRSDRHPTLPLSLSGHATRISRLLDALDIGRTDVVGLSMGGGVAQKLVLE